MMMFICALLLSIILPASAWDYTFERVENMNDTGPIMFNFKVTRVNRTIFALSGNMTMRSEVGKNLDKYYQSTNFYNSPLGNNQYTKMALRFPRMPVCQYMNGLYRKYFMKSMKPPASTFPYSDDPNEDLCNELRVDHDVVFTLKNFMIDKSVVPPFVPNGMMRIDLIFDVDETVVGGMSIFARTENEESGF